MSPTTPDAKTAVMFRISIGMMERDQSLRRGCVEHAGIRIAIRIRIRIRG